MSPDIELVLRYRAGDTTATGELYAQARKATLQASSSLHVRFSPDVEDLQQEALAEIFKSLPAFSGGSQFATWAYRVSFNKILGLLKRKARGQKIFLPLDETLPLEAIPPQSDPILPLLEAELPKLPAKQRAALILCGMQRMSYAEAAEVVGVSEDVFKGRIQRARENIKRLLGERHAG